MIHELKTYPQYFNEVKLGYKKFEVRKFDRNYQLGDTLVLKEWFEEYTGQELTATVTYILSDSQFVKEDYVIMGIEVQHEINRS